MATTTQTLGTLTQENKTFYERALLTRLTPKLVFARYGQKKPLPKREGDTVNFRRVNSLAAAATPLTEGVTPDGSNLTISTVTAQVQQYGDYVEFSDKIDTLGIDPLVTETLEIQGEQAGLTIDDVVRDVVTAGTNVQYAGGRASRDAVTAADKITADEVAKAVKTLKKANAEPLEGGYYVGVIDPDTAYDLAKDPLWQDVSKYNGGTAIMRGEIGKLHGVRFIETSNVKVVANASAVNVHCCMILGKGAYGVIDVDGSSKKPQVIVKDKGSAGTADPLDQRSTVGWKAMFTAVRLQELAMVRLECAVTE